MRRVPTVAGLCVCAASVVAQPVAVGQIADFLIVSADPSAGIRNTRRMRSVIKEGRIVR